MMKNAGLISIIVPVYNAEKYFCQCIESILTQSYSNFELILIDDGSPDRCSELCDEYARLDSRIKTIHQKNSGVSVARNTGLKVAKGEYVVFCDSDDEVKPDYLLHFMDKPAQYDLVIGGFQYIDNIGKNVGFKAYDFKKYKELHSNGVFELIGKCALSSVWGKRFNRSIIERYHILFDPELEFAEDTLFSVQYMIHSNSILVLQNTDYCYRKYDKATLNSYRPTMYSISLKADQKIITAVESRFPGLEQSFQWKQREWPILRNCLFGAINDKSLSLREKMKLARCILNNPCFPKTMSEIEENLPHDGRALKIILRCRSARLLLLFFHIYHKMRKESHSRAHSGE